LFISFNLLGNALNAKIKFFQSILMILAGSFLILWFYFSQVLKKEFILKTKHFKTENLLAMGVFFGLSLTSCSLGFQISAIVLSVGSSMFNVLLNSLLFSFGLIMPMFIVASFMKSLDVLTRNYERYENVLTLFSNFLILLLGYYFIYIGSSSFHVKSFVETNYFYFILIIYLYVLVYLFIKTLQLKSLKKKILSFIVLISLILLFISHCLANNSCVICYLYDLDCMIKIVFFVLIVIAEFFILKNT